MADEPTITRRKLTDYTPDPHNANQGSERGQYMVDTSVEQVGAGRSLVATKDGVIAAGNKTLQALVDAGIVDVIEVETDGKTAVVVKRTDWDGIEDEQARKYAYFDNRASEVGLAWDAEQLLADLDAGVDLSAMFRDDELDALLDEVGGYNRPEPGDDPGAEMDRAEELREKWQTERGQVWDVPSATVAGRSHRVMCGDSTSADDVAQLMREDRAEMVWTDPPYGVAIGDKNKMLNAIARSNRVEENLQNDALDEAGLLEMLEGSFDLAIDHCKPGAAWYVAAPPGPLHVLFGQALKDRGIWRQTIQWVKNNATFSPMGVDYHWQAEPIFYGWIPNAGHRYHGGRKQTTVWEIDRPTKSPEHPTMKPPELVLRAVENSSERGDLVLDVFLGSGTTAVAAEQTARICYGMEIAPKYVAVTLERLAGMGLEPRLVEDAR